MSYLDEVPIGAIDRPHPEYKRRFDYFERLRKLYEGGQTMRLFSDEFLLKRAMEPGDVYADRKNRFGYINHLSNIIGWYVSALFKDAPTVIVRKRDISDDTAIDAAAAQAAQLAKFQDNCDGAGRSLIDFWAQEVEPKLLLFGRGYILFDLPTSGKFLSKQQQLDANALQPHLVAYSPQDIINWETDDAGNLTWLILKVRVSTQDDPFRPPVLSDRWYLYTPTEVVAYEALLKTDENGALIQASIDQYGENKSAKLMGGYPRPHALSEQERVPFFVQRIHHIHWIADRVASPLCGLLNLENGFDWSLEVTNLAMLCIYSDSEEVNKITRSEAAFLQLGQNDKAAFLEQSGAGFTASQNRINELREEIYRLAYLIDQGRSSSATASSQSGVSKEQDKMPAQDVLSALGDRDRTAIQQLLQTTADSMELDVDVDVQGFDFGDSQELAELEVIERGTTVMPMTSTTEERAVLKKVARYLLPDANRETLAKIDAEIEANPTPNEAQQALQEQQMGMRLANTAKLNSPRDFKDVADAA